MFRQQQQVPSTIFVMTSLDDSHWHSSSVSLGSSEDGEDPLLVVPSKSLLFGFDSFGDQGDLSPRLPRRSFENAKQAEVFPSILPSIHMADRLASSTSDHAPSRPIRPAETHTNKVTPDPYPNGIQSPRLVDRFAEKWGDDVSSVDTSPKLPRRSFEAKHSKCPAA